MPFNYDIYFFYQVMPMITCPQCPGTRFETVRMLLKHIRMTHSDHAAFSIQCNLQGCRRTFRTLSTYLGHVYTHHDSGILDVYEPDNAPCGNGQDADICDDVEGDFDDSTMVDNTIGDETVQSFEAVMQRAAATWILKTRECHRIPLTVMNEVISDLQSLLQVAHSQLAGALELPLSETGVSAEAAERIRHEIHKANPALIFQGLQTQSQQLQYFRTHFRLVVSS